MYKILILCSLPTVFSIIVKDPVPTEGDYKYSYEIEDLTTGDRKRQHEVRQGDFVSGAYSFLGPDGTQRTVEYTADSKHGFRAVVREEPVLETTVQPTMKIPYVSKTRIYTKPIYTLEAVKLPIQYDGEGGNPMYFTPENEILEDKIQFRDGQYFEPAK